jgi:hypothetical protein
MIVKVKNPFSLLRRPVSFRFDTFSYFKICELNGIELDEIEKLTEHHIFLSWLYGAYLSDCAYNYRKPKHDFAFITKLYRWYYVNEPEGIERLKSAMLQARIVGKDVTQWSAECEEKKKK